VKSISTRRARPQFAVLLVFAWLAAAPGAGCAPNGLAVEILHPPLLSRYGQAVEVTARVSSPAGSAAVSWCVLDSALGGTVTLDAQGSFAFRFATAGLPDVIYVEVTAKDAAGRFARSYVALFGPRSRMPSSETLKTESGPELPRPAVLAPAEEVEDPRPTASPTEGEPAPSVLLDEPGDGRRYGSRLRIRGRIVDPHAALPGADGIGSARYEFHSREIYAPTRSPASGEVPLNPDGSFDFIVPTRQLQGPQELRISVRAAGGRAVQALVPLEQAEADIPSFAVSWTEGAAVADWEELPGTERYTLVFWKENPGGSKEPESRVEGVRSPHRLTGLEPGNLYGLRLLAAAAGEADSWSVSQRILPVTGDVLRPMVSGEYGRIRVSWAAVPGSREYRVWRSTDPQGAPTDVSGSLDRNLYVDTQVAFGRRYYYRITPAAFPSSGGATAWAETTPFPEKRAAVRGELPCDEAPQVSLSGGYARVSAGARGVRVIDVSTPEAPAEAGVIPARAARAVAVAGSLAYVADGPHGLRVIDIAEPHSPVEIGFRDTGDARRVLVRGGLAFVADGEHGLKVLDVSRPTEPVRAASLDTLTALDLALHGDFACVAAGPQGLRIVDLTAPRRPREAATWATPAARAVAVQGELAFGADGQRGLAIVDVSEPSHPARVSGHPAADAVDVAVSGRFAYLADAKAGLLVLEVSDPHRPRSFAELPLRGISGLAVRGSYVYAATAAGLQAVHVVNEGTSFSVASCPVPGGAYALSLEGGHGYVSGHRGGVQALDLTQPDSVGESALRGGFASDYALHTVVRGRHAYVADGRRGIKITDVSAIWDADPATVPPACVSFFTGGWAWRLAVQGDRLYVADGTEGLKVLDVTDPLRPVEVAAVATIDARDVTVDGSLLWLADGKGGLKVYDVAGQAPVELSTVQGLEARRVRAAGSLVCAAGPEGVAVFGIEDPRRPARVGSYPTAHAEAIDLSDGHLFVAEGHRGLTVLDLAFPERPQVISRCAEVYAIDVAVRGDWAFVPDAERVHAVRVLVPRWLQAAARTTP